MAMWRVTMVTPRHLVMGHQQVQVPRHHGHVANHSTRHVTIHVPRHHGDATSPWSGHLTMVTPAHRLHQLTIHATSHGHVKSMVHA